MPFSVYWWCFTVFVYCTKAYYFLGKNLLLLLSRNCLHYWNDHELHLNVNYWQDLAQLIVERATLISNLLPQEESSNSCAQIVLAAMIHLFYNYLIKAQQNQREGYSWVTRFYMYFRQRTDINFISFFAFVPKIWMNLRTQL